MAHFSNELKEIQRWFGKYIEKARYPVFAINIELLCMILCAFIHIVLGMKMPSYIYAFQLYPAVCYMSLLFI